MQIFVIVRLPWANKFCSRNLSHLSSMLSTKLLHFNILCSKNDFTQILDKYDLFFSPQVMSLILKDSNCSKKKKSSIRLSGKLYRYYVSVILYIDCKFELASCSKLPLYSAEANFLLSRPTHFREGMKELLQKYTSS